MALAQEQGLEQYALARRRIKGESQASQQTTKDALARRFASLGNLNSGARIKIEQKAQDQSEGQLNNALEGVDAAEQAELARRREVQLGREFQTSERLGSEKFASGERLGSEKFASGERLGAQDFAALQAKLGRDFTTSEREAIQRYSTSERLGSQDFAGTEARYGRDFAADQGKIERLFAEAESKKGRDFQGSNFNKDRQLAYEQLKSANEQFNQTFKEEMRVNDANIKFAERVLSQKGMLENFFGEVSNAWKKI